MFRPMLILGVLALPSGINSQLLCPFIVMQDICPNSNVTFWLYNKHHTGYKLDEASISTIQNATFTDQPTKILLHGYGGNMDIEINKYLKPEYVDLGYNVISADYRKVTPKPCYLQTISNAPIISKCFMGFIIALLKSGKVSLDKMHVLGFDMGAQVAGKTGKDLRENHNITLQRLTGLDASGPPYPLDFSQITAKSAFFVDAIHSHAAILISGHFQSIGQVDFYCNIGLALQSGCSSLDDACYIGSLQLFAESIKKHDHKFCGRRPAAKNVEMGERVPTSAKGIYYVITNVTPPYAADSNSDC